MVCFNSVSLAPNTIYHVSDRKQASDCSATFISLYLISKDKVPKFWYFKIQNCKWKDIFVAMFLYFEFPVLHVRHLDEQINSRPSDDF